MKAPKTPKYKKAPKMPKGTASTSTWDNFDKKLKEIESHNRKLATQYKKELADFEKEKKRREKIKATAKSGLGKV